MSFKLKKLEIDLELNLSDYIPGEAGVINAIKTSSEELFEWMKHCTKIGDDSIILNNKKGVSSVQKLEQGRVHLINQIDYLYEQGVNYWKAIPYARLKEIIEYLREEVSKTEKK